jgi:pilus assembly protein CpaE
MKRIVLAGTTDQFAGRLKEALGPTMEERIYRWMEQLDGPATVNAILTLDPAVVMIGPALHAELALSLAAEFDRARPSVAVVIVRAGDKDLVDEALAVGARAVVPPEAELEVIRAGVTRAIQAVERRTAAVAKTGGGARPEPARVITVLAPKGGAGKTMISTNLSIGLASLAPRSVAIVDLDLQFGDVAFALGVEARHTIYDAVSTTQALDLTTLKVFLAHHPAELYALCAPDDPARGEFVPADGVGEIVSLLVSEFEYVVIDTSAGLSEHTLTAIDVSTDLVLVADMDVPSIKHLAKVIQALDRLGVSDARRHVVLNRADARAGLSLGDAAVAAGVQIDVEVPGSRTVPVALNTGRSLLLDNPRSPVVKALWKLVERVANPGAVQRRDRRGMKWSA